MSLWTDRTVKELLARVAELERRLDAVPSTETPEELIAAYVHKFNKKPHHFMKPESIREALK